MVDGHFEIGSLFHWDSVSSGFHSGTPARVAYPAVQGIMVTRGMALAFRYTVFCTCYGPCASLKRKLICPVIIF
jgi:hypothetical protein